MNNTGTAGGFLSGMADGMSLGMKFNDQQEQNRINDEERRRREEEARRQQQETAANIQSQQQSAPQGGMSVNPAMFQGMFSGGSAAGATGAGTTSSGTAAGSTVASGTGGMSILGGGASGTGAATGAGSAGSAGASGLGGAAAAAGPWAALAAIIAVNEKSARNGGHRRDGFQYGKDLIGGKVVEQDTNERWVPKVFGGYDDDKTGLGHDGGALAEASTLDFKNAAKKLENGTGGKIIKGIGKIFK